MKSSFKNHRQGHHFGLLCAVLFLAALLSLLSPQFLTTRNILNLLLQSSVNALLAAGMTLVIITGGIDLSVGSILGLTAVVTARILQSPIPVPGAILGGLALGAGLGIANGLVVIKGKIPPFIATLGMMTLSRGLALSLSGGRPVTGLPREFLLLASSSVLGIPTPLWIVAAVYLAGTFLLARTNLGRYIYAVGNNMKASRYAGCPVPTTIITAYTLSGMLAALAGMVLVARLDSAQPVMGAGYELNAIAAVVVGGAALSGGAGNLGGTLLGAIMMAMITNAINILNISPFYAQILQGVLILAALFVHSAGKSPSRSCITRHYGPGRGQKFQGGEEV
ncbi:ribose ABC transporter permease [Alkalispirochaeta sphaeroplastigenens]|uniref:Ribose ABC transporter permease n=1 Tax=Alkalispirochaeta sphaeroplastigenens TaxID=1187066 RepID=A0A2S4JJN0_9SPIO|nr:ABC transporter permease [Alkalispirochaeta sphaeroplastigenens]POQ99670.1 ribose ABC transporter permease [Alkalispirochaeta sphaeroplastigenens]